MDVIIEQLQMFAASFNKHKFHWVCTMCKATGQATVGTASAAANEVVNHLFNCAECARFERVTGSWSEDGQHFKAFAEKDGKRFVVERSSASAA